MAGFATTTMNQRWVPSSDETGSKPASFISRDTDSGLTPCVPSFDRSAGRPASVPGGPVGRDRGAGLLRAGGDRDQRDE